MSDINFRSSGLVKASPDQLSVYRHKHGRGFKYLESGQLITCQKQKKYLKALAIPPIYTDVQMTTNKRYHLQATGLDTKGNRQYFYHPKWENIRDTEKFKRLFTIGEHLPRIRRTVSRDLKRDLNDPRYILAGIVKLLDKTGLRIGNWRSVREHQTYGLITLHKRHMNDDNLTFKGKAGVEIERDFMDDRVYQLLETFYDNTERFDDPLFTIGDQPVSAAMVNDYLDDISKIDMTAKEFRTWRSCVLFVKYWYQNRHQKPTLSTVVEQVAEHTCNTPSILKSSYIAPKLVTQFKDDFGVIDSTKPIDGALRKNERLMLALL